MTETARYKRNPAVSETELEGEIFLVEPESQEVFYLDTISTGLWRLISAPQSLEEAVLVYQAAFPEIDLITIENDLRIALQTLLDRGLVVVVP